MTDRRSALSGFVATVALAALPKARQAVAADTPLSEEPIAILGTGHLGSTLGKRWASVGHRIVYGSRTPDAERVRTLIKDTGEGASAMSPKEAIATTEVVVFALPWKAVKDLLPHLGDLAGKIVIDPMNSLKFVAGYPEPLDPSTSTAEQLQSWLPSAKLVKAFNTPGAPNIRNPQRLSGPFSIPIAGTDRAAKERVASLVSAIGLDPVDTGPLIAARYLEAMMCLSFGYYLYTKGKASFEFYLRPAPVS